MNVAGPRIAWTCSLVPVELLEAAGCTPVRLSGAEVCGDGCLPAPLPARLCVYAQRCSQALCGPASPVDGVVLASSCVAMERLYDELRRGERFVHLLDVPRRRSAAAVGLLAARLAELLAALTSHFGLPQDEDGVAAAIRRRIERPAPWAGAPGSARPTPPPDGRPRLMLAGGSAAAGLVTAAIEELGGAVVLEESCETRTPPPGAPAGEGAGLEGALRALAARQLSKPPCPRMVDGDRRLEDLMQRAAGARVEGVVYAAHRGCVAHGYAHASLTLCAEVPVFFLELDGDGTASRQARDRLEAFLERVRAARRTGGGAR